MSNSANSTFIFLRHAETIIDQNIPADERDITLESQSALSQLIQSPTFKNIDQIYASTEIKAQKTAEPFLYENNLPLIQNKSLNEIQRNKDKNTWLTDEERHEIKMKMFDDLDYTPGSRETCNQALKRFSAMIQEIKKCESNIQEGSEQSTKEKTILIVTHWTVLSLYFASLLGKLDEVASRRNKLDFCSYWVVKGDRVVKDIV